ncbi:MAG: tRNA (N(6)-L-threonylcarbamoyladenosine(37)-C(2))-methylthiotransferase MtaB [Thermodesulfobacteriota bacterium]|nr:tRNA (N(6)-L-threonylcarbamoyladenosine(37)-C(2))-methylthiotransferase MtaB [Thermodesulfobacteriota bacterium]
MRTFIIKTLGCKVNQYESEVISAGLVASGWERAAGSWGPADLCIVNTCTVTGRGDMQSRQMIRRLRRENPQSIVIATGCYATTGAEELDATNCVDRVVPHSDKHRVPAIAEGIMAHHPVASGPLERTHGFFECRLTMPGTDASGSRTRPFLKIQDGCNAFCTYCIVPYARGRSVSMPPDDVLAAVRALGDAGYHEVVLTGIHIGAYGLDLSPPTSLYALLCRILESGNIKRIRLSSIEPRELTDDLIQLAADHDGICDHFHIPLQSGADAILKKMGRPYMSSFFADRVERIKALMPHAAIGADILAGFPGEDDRAFEETCDLIVSLPVTYLHVFPFSPRKGTPAWDYSDHVPPAVIKERTTRLRHLGNAGKTAFSAGEQGRILYVPVEGKRDQDSGRLKGVTANYLTVLFDGPDDLKGAFVPVKIGNPVKGLCVRAQVEKS